MKILFITEYFDPYIHGGAEISVYQLAKKLVGLKNSVWVLTPNYGILANETLQGVNIIRFPWPIHFRSFSSQLSPAFFANPVTWIYTAIVLILENRKIKADVLHSQSVNSFPAVWLAAKLTGKKCVVNIRDNQLLCSYGWCLSGGNGGKTCSLKEYFLEDFKHYYKDKVKHKGMLPLLLNLVFAAIGRLRTNALKFLVMQADMKICGSISQSRILMINGIKADPIYNIFEFPKDFETFHSKKEILYATKLSEGKGLGLLLRSWARIEEKLSGYKLRIVGDGDRKLYEDLARKLKISKTVIFDPMPDFKEIRKIRQSAALEVVPSIYPESFGRAALEAIALGIPVVTTNRGGLPEIVEDGVTGYVVEPEETKLADAIIKGVGNNRKLRQNIFSRHRSIKNKFEIEPIKQYIEIYRSLL